MKHTVSYVHYYRCISCGNIMKSICTENACIQCCGLPMKEISLHTRGAAAQTHLPLVTRQGNTICVDAGSRLHSMQPQHRILWIALETNQSMQHCLFLPHEAPIAIFHMKDAVPKAVYSYCNIHGLWKLVL